MSSSGNGDRPRDHLGASSSSMGGKKKTRTRIDPADIRGHISSAPDLHSCASSSPTIEVVPFGTMNPLTYHSQFRRPRGASSSSQPRFTSYDQTIPLPTVTVPRPYRFGSSGTPSPNDQSPSSQSPHLSSLRLRDSSDEVVTPPLTQHNVHPSISASPASAATPEVAPDVTALAPGQRDRLGRVLIVPDGVSWHPSKNAANALQESVRRLFNEPYHSWGEIPSSIRQAMFNEFKTMCTWDEKYNMIIATTFERKASSRLSSWLKKSRDDGKPGRWLQPHIYEELRRYWETDEFKALSEQAKKGRASLKGGSLHTGGAKSVGTISREMEKQMGRVPFQHEVFKRNHIKKKDNESDPDVWVEQRAEQAYQHYERYVRELGDDVQLTPELSEKIWTDKVVGGSHKGRIYGMGSRNDIRRIQSGLEGIGSSRQAEALDRVQLAAMSQKIEQLSSAFAASEARRFEQQKEVVQIKEQVLNLARRPVPRPSTPEYESDDDEFVENSP